ncbi:MAG: Fic family protein [Candidatus Babeliales bacterium]
MHIIRKTGDYEKIGSLNHFIPSPLPPSNPPLQLTSTIIDLYGKAMHQLGRLNEMAQRIPDSNRFLKAYVTKEALLSSEIEGIHTTLIDVFSVEQNLEKPNKDTQLVLNYSNALYHSLELIQELPISSRVLRQAHDILLSGGEGDKMSPGEFRKQSVRVGNLVPPPAPAVPQLMGDLEQFINTDTSIPPLIKAGLAHVQFETIHPFLDGNGRIGRLLIILMLINDNIISKPLLYPSYFFKKHHAEYYKRLDEVRVSGNFEEWILYYLQAIAESAHDAWLRATDIEALETAIEKQIISHNFIAKTREDALNFLKLLFQNPIIGVNGAAAVLNRSYNTANKLIHTFIDLKILQPSSRTKRDKIYIFDPYLKLLNKNYRSK